jgi:serine/threonine protein phosphatase PrpC
VLGALNAQGSMGDRFRAAQAAARKEAPGSGTTMVAAYIRSSVPRVIFRGVGDSQGYILHRGGHMTVALDLDNDGRFLRRWIGDGKSFGTSVEFPVAEGEWVVLCSDGLDGHVPPETIRSILANHRDTRRLAQRERRGEAMRALLRAARNHGSEDDVTIVIAEV